MILAFKKILTAIVINSISLSALAGTCGQENWGEMYWGNNSISAPIVAPNYTVRVDGDEFIVEFASILAGTGDDGWSAITGHTVICDGAAPVVASGSTLVVSGLESDTAYRCSVAANNAVGIGPIKIFEAVTDPVQGGLPIWLLLEATKQ